MSAAPNKKASAKDEAVAIAIRCRATAAPAARKSSVAYKPTAPAVAAGKAVSVATAPAATVRNRQNDQAAPANPFAGMGLTSEDADKLAFLGRCGAVPERSALGAMPSTADFKSAAVPIEATNLSEKEAADLAFLKRAGFGASAKPTRFNR